MDIIKATPSDVSELAILNMDVQQLHVAAHPDVFKDLSLSSLEEWFARILEDDACRVFVGRHAGQAVGYMVLALKHEPENLFQKPKSFVYVDHISVRQAYRGRGFGKEFIEFAKAFARSAHCARLLLDVWAFNHQAMSFFASQGLRPWMERMELTL